MRREQMNAHDFAAKAHSGQVDKIGKPYIEHLTRVSARLPEELKDAGFLHDILEDTDVTEEDLVSEGFDSRTVSAVVAVTRVPGETYFEFIQRVCESGIDAIEVKIADVEDHLEEHPGILRKSMVQRYEKAITLLYNKRMTMRC